MSRLIHIYFAGAVRGAAGAAVGSDTLAGRIQQLERFGVVTTRHMAHAHSLDKPEGDAAIYAHDDQLLRESDVFIGDFTSPSTGSGFMAARAVELGKPVLALFAADQRPSAMLAGHPNVVTKQYANDTLYIDAIRAFLAAQGFRLRAPKIVLAGPPGSGKGTLGAVLSATLGAPHISTGELLRALPVDHPLAAKVKSFMQQGQLVPAELMRELVLERLGQKDCTTFGFILDGYPPSKADLENLRGVEIDLVFLLECDDATAIDRQVTRAARSTDTPEKARTRLGVFRDETPRADWFPKSITVRLDATRSREQVTQRALETIDGLFGEARRERSYFPSPAFSENEIRSTRLHFHIDAPTTDQVRAIAREVYRRHPAVQGQLKLYPIESLRLGRQQKELSLYKSLPNFRSFERADDEAFITGRLGDGGGDDDDALMRVVIDATKQHGGMTELEEYTLEAVMQPDEHVRIEAKYEPLQRTQLISGITPLPKLELHLGFDLPRLEIPVKTVMDRCEAEGMNQGGWFIFKKSGAAAYRSNEFSSLTVTEGEARVTHQALVLSRVLKSLGHAVDVSFSVELVHGIWTF